MVASVRAWSKNRLEQYHDDEDSETALAQSLTRFARRNFLANLQALNGSISSAAAVLSAARGIIADTAKHFYQPSVIDAR